ncbi:hypothetical protein Cgig2_028863 [Carnegiea gigantea]|uniref:Uncharacterized protein n=1 Tax=Carnegiea gigantea TaxID=171969 RepID=A0A9Q1QMS0_9CARY|nr:hypothetical protein Cgig2_028863 [Carnegiea gigantea]
MVTLQFLPKPLDLSLKLLVLSHGIIRPLLKDPMGYGPSLGGKLEDGGVGTVTYTGGWTKCIVLKEGMGLEEVRRKVSEITGNDFVVRKLWYSLKYDWWMVMELEGDGDVRMFLKENDEHGYLYVGDSDGLKRHTQKATRSPDYGVICRKSGRDREDIVQAGRKGAGLKR